MTKNKDVVTDAQLSVLSIDKESILANGTDQAIITVQLKDSKGNDVKPSGEDKVTLISENKGTLSELAVNEGVFTCTVSSTTVGSEKIGFSLNDVINQNQVELKYIEEQTSESPIPPTAPIPPTTPPTTPTTPPKTPKTSQKESKVVVEFLCPFSRYSKGDIAGFDANYANELVEKRKVAKFYKK